MNSNQKLEVQNISNELDKIRHGLKNPRCIRYSQSQKKRILEIFKSGVSLSVLSQQLKIPCHHFDLWLKKENTSENPQTLSKSKAFKEIKLKSLEKPAAVVKSIQEARLKISDNIELFIPLNALDHNLLKQISEVHQ